MENLELICKWCHALTDNYAFYGRHHTEEDKLKCVNNRFK